MTQLSKQDSERLLEIIREARGTTDEDGYQNEDVYIASASARYGFEMFSAALTEARAQGAAEERERLAKLAEDHFDASSYVGTHFARWLRSNTGEG